MNPLQFLSTLGARGRVTIPPEIRQRLGIRPGDQIAFRVVDEKVTISRAENAFLAAAGSIPALNTPRTDSEMTEIAADEAVQNWAREQSRTP